MASPRGKRLAACGGGEDAVVGPHLHVQPTRLIVGQQTDVAQRMVLAAARGAEDREAAHPLRDSVAHGLTQVVRVLLRFYVQAVG